VALEPGDEAGSTEAAIGQDHRTNASRERFYDSQKGVLLELVLTLGCWKVVPIVGQSQQWRCPSLAWDGDA
jgi:hypothetical protein